MVNEIKIDDGVSVIIPSEKIKLNEFYKLMRDYEDGLIFDVVKITDPQTSKHNKPGENKQYFYMDIEYDIDGAKNTGISFNLGEAVRPNVFKVYPQNKLFEFIKLFYPSIDDNAEISINFDVLKGKMEDLRFKGKVISYYDNKRQLQHMLIPVSILD